MSTVPRSSSERTPSDRSSSTPARRRTSNPAPARVAQESAAIYPDTFDTPPSPEEIAAEAYNIYMSRGGGDGRDMDDWLEAERRLSEQRRHDVNSDTEQDT